MDNTFANKIVVANRRVISDEGCPEIIVQILTKLDNWMKDKAIPKNSGENTKEAEQFIKHFFKTNFEKATIDPNGPQKFPDIRLFDGEEIENKNTVRGNFAFNDSKLKSTAYYLFTKSDKVLIMRGDVFPQGLLDEYHNALGILGQTYK